MMVLKMKKTVKAQTSIRRQLQKGKHSLRNRSRETQKVAVWKTLEMKWGKNKPLMVIPLPKEDINKW